MKKIFFGLAAAAIAFSPLSVQVANANLVAEPTYDNLTEKLSFYRVTRGFVSPLLELDNNLNSKIEFTRLNTLTYMDYVFLDDIYINNITFKSDDSAQYQRILLMQNGQIRSQINLIDHPSGVIPINFDTTTIDTIKLQFNGVAGTQHTLAELEIVGKKATTAGANTPQGESSFVTPQVIAELLLPEAETNPGDGGDGTPVVDPPPVVEEPPVNDGSGDGVPVVEEPPVDVDGNVGTGGSGDGVPVVEEPPVDVDGNVGTGGSGDPVIPEEEVPTTPEDTIGDSNFIDNNGDGIEDPAIPEDGTVTPPVEEPVVEVPGEGGVITPEPPVEEPVVVTPPVEEPVVVVPPVEEPVEEEPVVVVPPVEEPVEEEPVVVNPPVLPVDDSEVCISNSKPLTPSVFHSKQFSSHYWVNSASLKLFTHNHYNEAYLLNNLKNSSIHFDGKKMTIEEFIVLLKLSKFAKYNNVKSESKDCVEAPKKEDDHKHKHNHKHKHVLKFTSHNHFNLKNLHEYYNVPVKKDYDFKKVEVKTDKYSNKKSKK